MSKIEIFHNPRCSKSRQGLDILEKSGIDYETVLYLKEGLTKSRLTEVVDALGIKPIELVRTSEKDWKENFKGKELSDDDVIEAMIAYPRLIQRPIVIKGDKAVIGRPPEKIAEFLNL